METLDSIIKVGAVTAVRGRSIEVCVDTTKNASHLLFQGELLKNVSVGSYIKIAKGFTYLVGKIEGEFITEDKSYTDKTYNNDQSRIRRFLNITLIGFLEGKEFKQGIKELPLIENEAYLLTTAEFSLVHKFVLDGEETFILGTLAQEKGKSIELSVDRLFASHIGIFGNTGSGKSYTLAKLYHEIISKYKNEKKFRDNARFLLIDFNGEYVNPLESARDHVIIEQEFKSIYRLSTAAKGSSKKYPISLKTLNDVQFWALILHCTEKTQAPFVHRAIKSGYMNAKIRTNEGFKLLIIETLENITTKVNANQEKGLVTSFLEDMLKFGIGDKVKGIKDLLTDYRTKMTFHTKDKVYIYDKIYSNKPEFIEQVIKAKVAPLIPDIEKLPEIYLIRLKIIFRFYYEIHTGYSNREHIAPVMGRLDGSIGDLDKVVELENDTLDKNLLSIISLKDVNMQMRKVLPLLICKQAYEDKKHSNDKIKYLNIIIDEAHNILSYNSEREAETWKDYRLETFEEIIKEGRKFGVFLTIASQRPSDISTTIISQLHNYFLHRLINNKDIEAVEKTISYLDKVSFDSLPILPQGTCILAGLAAQLPVVIEVDRIADDYKPHNETMSLSKNWKDEAPPVTLP